MRTALVAAFLLALTVFPPPAGAGSASLEALREAALPRALAYLALQPPSEYVAEAVLGAGLDPGLWPTPATNLLDLIAVPAVGTSGNDPIREIHAIAQSGYDPHRFQGRDLVADLKATWPQSNQGVGQHAFTILGLHAAGVERGDPLLEEVVTKLQQAQFADGGWACVGLPSADCTGFALVALRSVDAFLPKMAERAKAWLDSARMPNGGYGSLGASPTGLLLSLLQESLGATIPVPDPWCSLSALELPACQGEANTDSTIWAINGYRALGLPAPEESWRFILDLQQPDGSFAWKAPGEQPITRTFATTEIVAGWLRSFHEWPRYAPATVLAPGVLAGVDAAFRLEGRPTEAVTWTVLEPVPSSTQGNPASLRLPPGTVRLHVEGRGGGTHHRERFSIELGNQAPTFLDLPAQLVARRAAALSFAPRVADPEDGWVGVEWSFGPQSGTGPVAAVPHELGSFPLLLKATDAHGAGVEATVSVLVVNAEPVLQGLHLPAQAPAGAVAYAATAVDPDGAAPGFEWDFGPVQAAGASGTVTLDAGSYDVALTVRDADGASLTVHRALLVVPLPSLPAEGLAGAAPDEAAEPEDADAVPAEQGAQAPAGESQAGHAAKDARGIPALNPLLALLGLGLALLARRASKPQP